MSEEGLEKRRRGKSEKKENQQSGKMGAILAKQGLTRDMCLSSMNLPRE